MTYWACAQLEPSRERLALHCLSKVNVYSPRIRPPRARREDDTRPLFPGYCFVLIVLQWHAARWSPGVVRIVLDGMTPARVPDAVIAEIRRRECGGVVQLPKAPDIQIGERVRVLGGPFQGHLGFYAGMRPHARVEVLLALLAARFEPPCRRVTSSSFRIPVARERDGLVRLPERQFRPGVQVRVLTGPFHNHIGIFSDTNRGERVGVLLNLLGAERRVAVLKDHIEVVDG
jgi:transcription antitermination factor NusG